MRRRLVRSYITSTVSISLVLLMVAAAALFAANASNIGRYFKENMAFSIMLKQSASEQEAHALSQELLAEDFVKDSRYISKEQGAEEMKALLGDDFLDIFEASPIPMSIELHLGGEFITRDSLNLIKKKILSHDAVEEIVYQESLVEALNANLQKISAVVAVVIAVLLVISFALISNTVRLNIYARRFTIHTMSLVGAKRSFIARPFVIQGSIQGAVAGLVAAGILMALMSYIRTNSPLLASVSDPRITAAVLAGTILLGILICILSTIRVVSRVAYISKDDLYY